MLDSSGRRPGQGKGWATTEIGKASVFSGYSGNGLSPALPGDYQGNAVQKPVPTMMRAGSGEELICQGQDAQDNWRIRWIKCPHHK